MKTKKILQKKIRGIVSTQDVIMALVIGGIVAGTFGFSYMYYVSMARSAEAETQLREVHNLEEIYMYKHSKYSAELDEIKYKQKALSSAGGEAHYEVEIVSASNNSFVARATSITDFDQDGIFSVFEINQDKVLTEVVED